MPINNYGVWAAYPISYHAETSKDDSKSPHLSLFFDETPSARDGKFRAAINIKSTSKDSRLVYWINRRFEIQHIVESLTGLKPGFHALPSNQRQGLDYIRGNILDIKQGRLVEHDLPGEDNDIIDYISPIIDNAIKNKAKIFLYGEPFKDGGGIHDVHMNQGNSEDKFKKYNGVYQDGGVIFSFPDGHWEAIFLAFAGQKVHTDDNTGHPITDIDFSKHLEKSTSPLPGGGSDPPVKPGPPTERLGRVFITAALVNAVGDDQKTPGERETVILENMSSQDIDLRGWKVLNGAKQRQVLEGTLPFAKKVKVGVPNAPLSNKGGIITLLDNNDLKVDGVSYTTEQASREGAFLTFH
jgi:uncharacterized protein YukJ